MTSQRKKAHSPSSRSSASTALPGLLVQVGERGAPAPAHERLGRSPADARRGAGDEDDLGGRQAAARPDRGGSRSITNAPSRMTAFSASCGPGQQREVGERIAVDDDQVGERAGFDDADLRRRVDQELPGVGGAPA